MQFKRVETVCNERIAKALEGIQYELKRLNDSNPSNRAQVKQKNLRRKSLNLKISSEVVLMSKREAVGPGVTAPISRQ